ncbi:MAG: 2OG-Fe(II) oxygenase [Wenzhouxiangella sp.]
MINPAIDIAAVRRGLDQTGRVQIPEFLQPDVAEKLVGCLETEVPWSLALHQQGSSHRLPAEEYAGMDAEQRAGLVRELAMEARGQYGFVYESYMMIKAYVDQTEPGLMLHQLSEFLNSEPYLKFARQLTGCDQIRRVSAQATCYRPGHFLRLHTDKVDEEGRIAAYVINLTPRWNADFGGMLNFLGADGAVSEVFYPWFNSLSLFRVPAWHFVSPVALWANQPRLAITGWFQS